ncbi:hypothetical protein [Bacillus sp. NSP9.1]|uniref:hypothetical protein n=1 Tax=Bacillus sp. NSP9.1 TaxID=1071078 RepID=UPI0003FDAAF4|nr:hypothetical protein [Bacillus sp. NSP9.1]QHZ48095.1 hypothetical protein M654_018235 [Bacillus sp. NSP9.1]
MAQIVKIQDCISRYEQDPYHYMNQFIRLKKQRWQSLKEMAEKKEEGFFRGESIPSENDGSRKKRTFSLKRKKELSDINNGKEAVDQWFNGLEEEMDGDLIARIPAGEKELAAFFKERLYQFQLKWASSTISDISGLSREIKSDKILQILAQQLPDSYFIMYHPVLQVSQAAAELSIIILTPLEIYCLAFLEGDKESAFIGSKDRFWKEKTVRGKERSVLNPTTELLRTGSILSQLLKGSDIELPVRKFIISRTSYIDYPEPPYGIEIYDRRQWGDWLAKQQKNFAPIKSRQLKAAKILLSYGVSESKRRKEWLD